ncbi:MAG: site-specific integrase [Thiotrichales bacterium]
MSRAPKAGVTLHRMLEEMRERLQPNDLRGPRAAVQDTPAVTPSAPSADTGHPPVAAAPDQTGSKADLEAIHSAWVAAVPRRSPSTCADARLACSELARFADTHGLDPLQRQTLIRFRDTLRQGRGLQPKTVAKKLGLLGAMFQLAVDDERLGHNPAARIRVAVARTEKASRRPFTVTELNRLFASPIYCNLRRYPSAGGGAAAYWLPLIGLYSGMRLEEIAQLRVTDVRSEAGIDYLQVADDAEDQHLKTAQSRRRIPIHAELVRLGWLAYVAEQQRRGAQRLFADLRADCKGKLSGNWSKWFGRYLRRQARIDDPRLVFHSLRHTFRHACRECEVAEEIADALMGHAGGGTGRAYGGAPPLATLTRAMARVAYPGLVLPPPMRPAADGIDAARSRPRVVHRRIREKPARRLAQSESNRLPDRQESRSGQKDDGGEHQER